MAGRNGGKMGAQIDELSATVGEIRAFIREHQHTSENISAKFDSLGLLIRKEVAELENKLTQQIRELDASHEARLKAESTLLKADIRDLEIRVSKLEETDQRRAGALGIADWTLKTPLLAWLVGLIAVIGAFIAGERS